VCNKLAVLAFAACLGASTISDPASAVRHKLDIIQNGRAKPGSVFTFSASELNAYARSELPTIVPEGVRQPRLELGSGTATGSAVVDFLKLRHGQGETTPWLISKLIEGEKLVRVNARIQSAHGRATVYLQRVEISGLAVSGSTLDFLIHNFFLPLYPNAKINEPFELQDNVDRIEVAPEQARVVIRNRQR
jgi:hypothetical protein